MVIYYDYLTEKRDTLLKMYPYGFVRHLVKKLIVHSAINKSLMEPVNQGSSEIEYYASQTVKLELTIAKMIEDYKSNR